MTANFMHDLIFRNTVGYYIGWIHPSILPSIFTTIFTTVHSIHPTVVYNTFSQQISQQSLPCIFIAFTTLFTTVSTTVFTTVFATAMSMLVLNIYNSFYNSFHNSYVHACFKLSQHFSTASPPAHRSSLCAKSGSSSPCGQSATGCGDRRVPLCLDICDQSGILRQSATACDCAVWP